MAPKSKKKSRTKQPKKPKNYSKKNQDTIPGCIPGASITYSGIGLTQPHPKQLPRSNNKTGIGGNNSRTRLFSRKSSP